jgi:hypothetical protein
VARTAALAALFLALTILFTYPLSTRAGSETLDLGPDTRLFLWTLAWDVHALAEEPLSIFDANIFYPERRTLAFSEHQIGSALLAAPFFWASGNILLGMNSVLLLSSALSGLFAFYLGRELGLSRFAAVVVGIVFLLTPPRFFRLGQLHLATVPWIPLALAFLHRYARLGSRRHLLGAVTAFFFQALSGGQSALFLALAGTGLLAYLALFGSLRPQSSLGKDMAIALVFGAALNVPFLLPYLEVRGELGLERSLDEAIEWSPNASSYLASPTHAHRALLRAAGLERVIGEARAFLFPGIVPILLALAAFAPLRAPTVHPTRTAELPKAPLVTLDRALDGALVALFLVALLLESAGGVRFSLGGLRITASGGSRAALVGLAVLAIRLAALGKRPFAFAPLLARWRESLRDFLDRRFAVPGGFYSFLFLFSLWVSVGPSAGLYTALYRLVPGFDFIRVPSRFTLLTVLALAVLAGFGFERIRSVWARAAVVTLVLGELAAFPLGTTPISTAASPMDRLLAESPPGPVAVFPVPDPRDTIAAASRHSFYMLQSTPHFFPLVNGYSGFTPEGHDRLFRILVGFPNDEGLSELESLGVRYAVFHRAGYGAADWKALAERIEGQNTRLELLQSFSEGSVYRLARTSR